MNTALNRIEINPKILGGKPVIKNTRIPIYVILQMLRDGATFKKIIKEYPKLTEEDIQAAVEYSIYILNHPEEEIIPISD
ncbi:MAG: DUF433 domain-containing protein [Candidatus Heimdallarchaeota archaeon]|nr:DUF433 domain-containing protein [Candidatus Heimdallarchaeota archaeon]